MEALHISSAPPLDPSLASLILLTLQDPKLADAVQRGRLTTAALFQPILPDDLDQDTRSAFLAVREQLCRALGMRVMCWVPQTRTDHHHTTDEAITEPISCKRVYQLLPASALADARLRVSLCNATPHFRRNTDTNAVICNGCERDMPEIIDDAQLRDAVFRPVWSDFRWKTFLCESCAKNALALDAEQLARLCHSCFRRDADQRIAIRYASVNCATEPRRLPLCDSCAELGRQQLSTVLYETRAADVKLA